jgi:hypothetical protein
MIDPLVRFEPKVNFTDDCWVWTASRDKNGYGRFGYEGTTRFAHRVAYELLVEPIPPGLVIDHLCRNKSCVNPDHLETVPWGENIRRGDLWMYKVTHCPQGHPLDGKAKGRAGRSRRYCRVCQAACQRRWYLRKRASHE